MRRFILIFSALSGIYAAPLSLMPMPRKVEVAPGTLSIDANFKVGTSGYSDFRLEAAIKRLTSRIERQTGLTIAAPGNHETTLLIACRQAGPEYPALGEDESYQLDVSSSAARLDAPTVTGALRGLETFLQLIGPGPGGFQIPAAHIEDRPRFQWRGLMLDVSRHWMPIGVIERNLDAMAAVKLNVFHWHLSDDQGFRVESKKYPRLQQFGSDGNFYSQAEIRHVVAYARDRGIRVIPEFDIPGHTTAWVAGYPELASAAGPYAIERKWGVFEPALDPTREETYVFLDGFIGEMAALFPDAYFHIGGDEVDDHQWKSSASIQAFAREHHLTGAAELQAYFNRRVDKLVKKHGKIMIGWDEVLDRGLQSDTLIESWRGPDSLAEAAQQGYRGILAFGYYLDHLDPLSSYYANDPLSGKTRELSADKAARILGGEACLWSEYVSPETIDSRIWPHMGAIAERLWSPVEVNQLESMYGRLEVVSQSLRWLGVDPRANTARMLDRLSGGRAVPALEMLADASEATGIEVRRDAQHYTSQIPLNRFVDAVPPRSDLAQRLEQDVKNLKTDPVARAELRATLAQWTEVESALKPLSGDNKFLAELIPLAHNLVAVGQIGLRALDSLDQGQAASPQSIAEENRQLDALDHPVAEVRLAGVRPVRQLLAELSKVTANASVRGGNEPLCNRPATVLNWTATKVRPNITQKQMLCPMFSLFSLMSAGADTAIQKKGG